MLENFCKKCFIALGSKDNCTYKLPTNLFKKVFRNAWVLTLVVFILSNKLISLYQVSVSDDGKVCYWVSRDMMSRGSHIESHTGSHTGSHMGASEVLCMATKQRFTTV